MAGEGTDVVISVLFFSFFSYFSFQSAVQGLLRGSWGCIFENNLLVSPLINGNNGGPLGIIVVATRSTHGEPDPPPEATQENKSRIAILRLASRLDPGQKRARLSVHGVRRLLQG